MAVEIEVDTKALKRVAVEFAEVSQKDIPKAIVAALNRAATSTVTATKREAKKGYEIKEKDLMRKDKKGRPPIRALKASISHMQAGVLVIGRPKGLFNFKVKESKGKKKYIVVKVKKGSGYKKLPRKAFVLNLPTKEGGVASNVFMRKTKRRYPLVRLATVSVPQMVSTPVALANIQKHAQETLEKRTAHEIEYRLSKLSKVKGSK